MRICFQILVSNSTCAATTWGSYSRAALVFWPRSHRAAVLAKAFDPAVHIRNIDWIQAGY
jgi:hypothetical protein